MQNETQIAEALARLDANVSRTEAKYAEAETRLLEAASSVKEARAERRGAATLAALLVKADSDTDASTRVTDAEQPSIVGVSRGQNTGLTHVIAEVMRGSAGAVLTVDDVFAAPAVVQLGADRDQVRSGLQYLGRKKIIERAGYRGAWRLITNDFGPAEEAGPNDEASEDEFDRQPDVFTGRTDPHSQ